MVGTGITFQILGFCTGRAAEVKTGGESLELHLAPQPAPRLDYGACRTAAVRFQGGDAAKLGTGASRELLRDDLGGMI